MKIVLFGDHARQHAGRLQALLGSGFDLTVLGDAAPADVVAAAFREARVIVSNQYDARLPAAPQLQLLQSSTAGVERIDLASVPAQARIAAALGHEGPMAEFILCALLDHAIGYRGLTRELADGTWSLKQWTHGPLHQEISGRTLGVFGYGSIARETARRAHAFGMKVHALSRWSQGMTTDPFVDSCFTLAQRDAFLADLDYLLVTIPLNPATAGSVDADWFAAMSPRTVILNVSRGPVVDEAALYHALESGRIGGAILDVWYAYPDREDTRVPCAHFPFHTLENVVMTPHNSGRAQATFTRRWAHIADNIRCIAEGRQPTGVVRRG